MSLFYSNYLKRPLDFAAALILMCVLAPLLATLVIVVYLQIGRPVFFRQERPGLNGRPFRLLKFRTMTNQRETSGRLASDFSRRTPFGDLLRRTSLDELPQLINVIKGDMSVIGPRPLLMEYLPLYSPSQRRRHAVRPGITGLAQVNNRNMTTWDQRLTMDVWYVDHLNPILDLKILIWSLSAVFKAGSDLDNEWALGKFRGTGKDPDKSGYITSFTSNQ